MPLGSLQDAATAVLSGEGRVAPAGGVTAAHVALGAPGSDAVGGRSHNPCGEVGRKAECGKSARSV